jgi:hypothetical protein
VLGRGLFGREVRVHEAHDGPVAVGGQRDLDPGRSRRDAVVALPAEREDDALGWDDLEVLADRDVPADVDVVDPTRLRIELRRDPLPSSPGR